MTTKNKLATATLVAMAAGSMLLAANNSAEAFWFGGDKDEVELVHCHGVNKCAGHNDCKTAQNECAGHSKCKGHGFVAVPAEACDHLGGTIK